nr:MAG: ORF1 [TTV-like mini virus]
MPWYRNYGRRRRRRWVRSWRPRKTFWRRRWRRRRQPVRRKLRSLILRTYQPPCIRKCTIKGLIPLFWGTPERFINNYELYEMTPAPERLPSGGLFSLKNFTLEGLFAEHQYCRNTWTKTNNSLPLMRFTGAKIKFYKSEHIDYIVTYDTNLPLTASMDTYHTMHPGIHGLLPHKLIVTRKNKWGNNSKPYRKIKIKPPSPMQNKWYFQIDMAKTPLVQIRTSAVDLENYYTNYRSVSTTIGVKFLNPDIIKNINFKKIPTSGYSPTSTPAGTPIYLYSAKKADITQETKLNTIIFLGNTNKYQEGTPMTRNTQTSTSTTTPTYIQSKWGNPFYTKYLTGEYKVYTSDKTLAFILSKFTDDNKKVSDSEATFTETQLIHYFRYNPFRDQGNKNMIYIKGVADIQDTTEPPESEDLKNSGLPLWVLTFGFNDFQKKQGKAKHIDTDYLTILQTDYYNPVGPKITIPIDNDFINGKSPFESSVNPEDENRWYPCCQFQMQMLNTIALTGPGSPKTPTLQSIEAKIEYFFYFKWGGNLPPMDSITDPKYQKEFHFPTNLQYTNSLQNPTSRPEQILYSFDERRGELTSKAIKRLQRDWESKEYSITDGSLFQAKVQRKEETSSDTSESETEEETQTLLLKLKQQQLKHKRLKRLILQKMGIIQTLE